MTQLEQHTLPEAADSIELDLADIDLGAVDELEDSALGKILREVQAESNQVPQARHTSHSSYSSHGTAMW